MNTALTLTKSLINLLYPAHCASCGRSLESTSEKGVCDLCLIKIRRNPLPYCGSCGRSLEVAEDTCTECREMLPYFSAARSCCIYEDCLKELVHKFKYNNRRVLSGVFTAIMLDYLRDNPDIIDGAEIITFIPLHYRRLGERSFNQSELLASYIGRELGIPVLGCLEKTGITKNQNELSRHERLRNISGAFRIKRNIERAILTGSDILVIDDIMTTGATLNEASRILISAGARKVRCLTLARGA